MLKKNKLTKLLCSVVIVILSIGQFTYGVPPDFQAVLSESPEEADMNDLSNHANSLLVNLDKNKLPYGMLGDLCSYLILLKSKPEYSDDSKIPTTYYYQISNLIYDTNSTFGELVTLDSASGVVGAFDNALNNCVKILLNKAKEFSNLEMMDETARYNKIVNDSASWYKSINALRQIYDYSVKYGVDISKVLTTEQLDTLNSELYHLLEIANKAGIKLGEENSIYRQDVLNINSMKDLMFDDSTNDLSGFYLQGLAMSSTFVPCATKLNDERTYYHLLKDIDPSKLDLVKSYLYKLQPLYSVTGSSVVNDILSGAEVTNAKPITLANFRQAISTPNTQMVLVLKDFENGTIKLENEKPQTGGEQSTNAENVDSNNEAVQSITETTTTITDSDSYKYTKPVYFEGVLDYNSINSKASSKGYDTSAVARDNSNIMVANFNHFIANNVLSTATVSDLLQQDEALPIAMDMFGNICSTSGIVIIPAISNASLYSTFIEKFSGYGNTGNVYKNYMFFENMTFRNFYPYISSFNNQLLNETDNLKDKYMLAVDADNYESVRDAKSNLLNMNYYIKYMSAKDLKTRKKYWLWGDASYSTGRKLVNMSVPMYPFYPTSAEKSPDLFNISDFLILDKQLYLQLGDSLTNAVGQMQKGNYQAILNPPSGVIKSSGEVSRTTDTILLDDVALYNLFTTNFYYLIIDKATGKLPTTGNKHNGTFNTDLMVKISSIVSKGDSDVLNMLVGEIWDVTDYSKDVSTVTSIIAGTGELFHFSISNGDYKSTLSYTPKFTEIPFLDRITPYLQPLLVLAIVLIGVSLIFCWRPFNFIGSLKGLLLKFITFIIIIAFSFKVFPMLISIGMNYPTKLINSLDNTLNTLIAREAEEKNLKTSYYKSYIDPNTSQKESYLKLAELSMDEYKDTYDMLHGQGAFNKNLGFITYYDTATITNLTNYTYLKGNKICLPIPTLFDSFTIKGFDSDSADSLNSSGLLSVELKQFWDTPTEMHYFTPYHLMVDSILYRVNSVTLDTNAKIGVLNYPTGYKYTNFVRNYIRSIYYLKTPEERAKYRLDIYNKLVENTQDINSNEFTLSSAQAEAIIKTLNGLDTKLRASQDLLGIMEWSGIAPCSDNTKPFGKTVVDDIFPHTSKGSLEQTFDPNETVDADGNPIKNTETGFGVNVQKEHSMENLRHTLWYNNDYFVKARQFVEKVYDKSDKSSDDVAVIINGYYSDKSDNGKLINEMTYVNPQQFTKSLSNASYTPTEDGFIIMNGDYNVELRGGQLFSNGIYILDVATEKVNGLISCPVKYLATALGGACYYNSDYKVALVFTPNSDYYGPVGEVYHKALKVNVKTRDYIDKVYPVSNSISDENLIKTIALQGLFNFDKEFSTNGYKLYPQHIEADSLNYDVFLKQTFIPDLELIQNSNSNSLYYFVAGRTGGLGASGLIAFEFLILVYCMIRDTLLVVLQVLVPLTFTVNYLIHTNFTNKAWMGSLMSLACVTVVNTVFVLILLIPNAMTSVTTSGLGKALLLALLGAGLGIAGVCFCWYCLYTDTKNLGWRGMVNLASKVTNKLTGRMTTRREGHVKPKHTDEINEESVISDNLYTSQSNLKIYSAIDNYQSEINKATNTSTDKLYSNASLKGSTGGMNVTENAYDSQTVGTITTPTYSTLAKTLPKDLDTVSKTDYSALDTEGILVDKSNKELLKDYQEGKDYTKLGEDFFVTNKDIIKANSDIEKSTMKSLPESKELLEQLDKTNTPYTVDNGIVKFVDKEGKISESVGNTTGINYSKDDQTMSVPENAVGAVKDYLDEQGMKYSKSDNVFKLNGKMSQDLKTTLDNIAKPVEINGELHSPDSALNKLTKITSKQVSSKRIDKQLKEVSISDVGYSELNKYFKLKGEDKLYNYSLNLGNNLDLQPVTKDLAKVLQGLQQQCTTHKGIVLNTENQIDTYFNNEQDYINFRKAVSSQASDYFVKPLATIGDKDVSVYTLNKGVLETETIKLDDFNTKYPYGTYKILSER